MDLLLTTILQALALVIGTLRLLAGQIWLFGRWTRLCRPR
jgi:hypothetical protein